MAKTRITKWVFHVRTGYYPFMRQGAVRGALEAEGAAIASRAGEGVEVESEPSSGRRGTPRVAVFTATAEAKAAEARHRALSGAL